MINDVSIRSFIRYLQSQEVTVSLYGNDLKISLRKGVSIDKELLEDIRKRKTDIIAYLTYYGEDILKNEERIVPVCRTNNMQVPLSHSQERLWFLDQLTGSSNYHIPAVLRIEGLPDIERLREAFVGVLLRHEVLRSVIRSSEGIPYQQVQDAAGWSLSVRDVAADYQFSEDYYVKEVLQRSFDLSQDYMLRAELQRYQGGEQVLVIVLHHIASDGWSVPLLIKELLLLYSSPATLAAAPVVQYGDYAIWERRHIAGEVLEQGLNYWRSQLQGAEVLSLPYDCKRPRVQSIRGDRCRGHIDHALLQQLEKLSQLHGVTMFMTLVSVFKVMLYRYTGQNDIVIGTPVANRTREEIAGLIGLFVNTVVLRSEVGGEMSFSQLLQQVRETTVNAYQYQHIPFEKVVEALEVKQDMSRHPLFQVMFTMQQQADTKQLHLPGDIVLSRQPQGQSFSKFDLLIEVKLQSDGIVVNIDYCTDLFELATIERMIGHYIQLVVAVVDNANKAVGTLEMIGSQETQQLMNDFNSTSRLKDNETIASLFEQQVIQQGDKLAVIDESAHLSYRLLNERSNRLAWLLKSRGVEPGDMVAVCMERSVELVVAQLGILKAGAAYIPVDPTYPESRIRYMVEDTGSKVVVTDNDSYAIASVGEVAVINISTDMEAAAAGDNPYANVTANSLAYVIYTSGSTGNPKGVMVEHKSVVRLVKDPGYVRFSEDDILLSTAAICFDATIFEYWGMLLNGGTLVFCNQQQLLDTSKLAGVIAGFHINMIWFTASWLNYIIDEDVSVFRNIKTVLAGGDKLSAPHIAKLLDHYPDVAIINGYGPTENTTFSSCHSIKAFDIDESNNISIGKPIKGSTAYILNEYQQLCPVGVAGEIFVGGIGVARGYLNQPELTEEKFIPDPFEKGGRLYRTGDIGYWRKDGSIMFLGRRDEQVKIRGYRIELAEVEMALQSLPGVKQSVVQAWKDQAGELRLTGYVVMEGEFDREALLQELGKRLPGYMIPSALVSMERLPLTGNGKVDKKALPAAESLLLPAQAERVAARTKTERVIVEIWEVLLGVEQIGIYDNFFELGGHSLLATRVVSAIRKKLSIEINIKDFFSNTTVSSLAQFIDERGEKTQLPTISKQKRPEKIPLSFAQERLWFIHKLQGSAHYHISAVLRLQGALDNSSLEYALREITNRHEILRTNIAEEEGQGYQQIRSCDNWILTHTEVTMLPDVTGVNAIIKKEIERPFDLGEDPVFRVNLLRLTHDEHLLILVIHHIAADGWSMSILVKELTELYLAATLNRLPALSQLNIQYADYAIWQRNYLIGEVLNNRLAYWEKKLSGLEPLNLPTDFNRPAIKSLNGKVFRYKITEELTGRLKAMSIREDATLFMTLLSVFKILLYRYSGQHDICVGTPISNRTHNDTESLIGFFVNTLALRTDLSNNPAFSHLLAQVKATALEAYAHQDVPFEKVVDRVEKRRDLSRTPVFQVMFILHNTPDIIMESQDIKITTENFKYDKAKFDLTFNVMEVEDGLNIVVEYCSDLFLESTIQKMTAHYQQLLLAVANNPVEKVGVLPMLGKEEEDHLLSVLNNTVTHWPQEKTILDLFEEQVQRTPDAIAITFKQFTLTYKELDLLGNRLGDYLRVNYGIMPDDLIAIKLQRSEWMIIALLGVLKSGAACMPVDITYPESRIEFMIADSSCKEIIDEDELVRFQATSDCYSTEKYFTGITPQNLVYCIYTSGTTGNPKGVLMPHKAVVNLVTDHTKKFAINGSNIAHFGNFSFDVSFQETFITLCLGGNLHIISQSVKEDPSALIDYIVSAELHYLFLPTAFFRIFQSEKDLVRIKNSSIRAIIVAGEQLVLNEAFILLLNDSAIQLYNHYGPTETHVVTDHVLSTAKNNIVEIPPVGRPIQNTSIYIMDQHDQLVPVGVYGELYIGGANLANGYLNDPELTAQKFIENPYQKGQRMYRTGDLARWLPDGNLEYLGRIDKQVKIRGFRVDPGEVESVLQQSGMVKQCVVIDKEDRIGNKYLVAYVVATGHFKKEDMLSYVSERLPEYMVPAVVIPMETLPITGNGKIDKSLLPDAVISTSSPGADSPPKTAIEKKLADILLDLLQVNSVSMLDNFFEMGGHSLKAVRLVALINKYFAIEIYVSSIYSMPTIQALADYISSTRKASMPPIRPLGKSEFYPVSGGQEMILNFDNFNTAARSAYNIPLSCNISVDLDTDVFKKTLQVLIGRHEVLRTYFVMKDGGYFQKIKEDADVYLSYNDICDISKADKQQYLLQLLGERRNTAFELNQYPLYRFSLIKTGENEYAFVAVFHHIIFDGWSRHILLKEIAEIYQALIENRQPCLPDLPIQYKDFASWQNELLKTGRLQSQYQYWINKLGDKQLPMALPLDFLNSEIKDYSAGILTAKINNHVSEMVDFCKQERISPFIYLLSCVVLVLNQWTESDDIIIAVPCAGRFNDDTASQIGFYVNMLPLCISINHLQSFPEFTAQVEKELLSSLDNQMIPFTQIVNTLAEHKGVSGRVFNVVVNMGNIDISRTTLTDEERITTMFRLTPVKDDATVAYSKNDLTFSLNFANNRLHVHITYSSSLFREETIVMLLARLENLFNILAYNAASTIKELQSRIERPGEQTYATEDWTFNIDY